MALAGRVVAEAMGIGLLDTRWTADALVAGALDGSTSSTGGGTIFAGLNDDGIVEEACGAWNFGDGCVRVNSLGFDFDFETNDVFGHYSYGQQLCSAF